MPASTSIRVHRSPKVEIVHVTAGTASWTDFRFYDEDGQVVAEVTAFDHQGAPVPINHVSYTDEG